MRKFEGKSVKLSDLKNICFLFEEQARKTPHRLAAISQNETATHQELNLKSDFLARHLIRNGVGKGVFVGVSLENSVPLIVSILAVLKAGGVYLPLDPSYPQDRLFYMVQDAKPAVILTEASFGDLFAGMQTPIFYLDRFEGVEEKEGKPFDAIDPEQLAYVIYTSGSTGKPKGILVTHACCTQIATAHRGFYPEPMTALVSGAISFDVSLLIIFHVLTTGGTLALCCQKFHSDPQYILNFIKMFSVNFLLTVPSFYQILLQKGEVLKNIQCVGLTGENLFPSLVDLHAKFAPNAFLLNEYGPSEYAIGTSIGIVYDPRSRERLGVTAGKPLSETYIYLLDSELVPVPTGDKGEIYIAGRGLARGYLNQEKLTQEKFVTVSFEKEAPIRLYRTGDLGRINQAGDLEFLGRIDHQVKIRGNRVELGEIEHAICAYPGIEKAVVIAHIESETQMRLGAFFSARSVIAKELIINYLTALLPSYMIPVFFQQIDQFPLTPNGKVDRNGLAELMKKGEQTDATRAISYFEVELMTIWKQILKREEMGIRSNFFDLGGDSLSLASVQTLIQKNLSLTISMSDLFQFPTIFALAAHLQQKVLGCKKEGISQEARELSERKKSAFKKFQKAGRSE